MNDLSLIEFLKSLNELNQANIDFMNGKEVHFSVYDNPYYEYLKRIQELINTFDFVETLSIDPKILTHPVPESLKEMFSKMPEKSNKSAIFRRFKDIDDTVSL